jgi:uncharacterized protein
MHINVSDILAEEVGYRRTFTISGERPELDEVILTKDIDGEITIGRLETGLLVEGSIQTGIQLDCHRCLRTFTRPVHKRFSQVYSATVQDDELPIEGDQIDLAPLIQQEILVSLPIKILCRPDCPGVEGVEDRYNKTEETGNRLQDQARITKGSHRGRTEETNHS